MSSAYWIISMSLMCSAMYWVAHLVSKLKMAGASGCPCAIRPSTVHLFANSFAVHLLTLKVKRSRYSTCLLVIESKAFERSSLTIFT